MAGGIYQKITVEAPVTADDAIGGQTLTFQAQQDIWANVSPLKANEIMWARQAQLQTTHRVRCWYFDGLTTRHRLTFLMPDGRKRIFNITGIINTNEANVEYIIDCTEKTSG